jgi:hypothetical protein
VINNGKLEVITLEEILGWMQSRDHLLNITKQLLDIVVSCNPKTEQVTINAFFQICNEFTNGMVAETIKNLAIANGELLNKLIDNHLAAIKQRILDIIAGQYITGPNNGEVDPKKFA